MRFTRIREILAAACVAVSFSVSSCKGPTEPGVIPPPPPVPETLSVMVTVPATVSQTYQTYPMALVVISVTASSNKGPVTTSCTLDGETVNSCGSTVVVSLGTHTICATARSIVTGITKDACGTTVATESRVVVTAVGFDANGVEVCPVGSTVVFGAKTAPQDSAVVGSDCKATVATRYVGMGNVPVEVRGNSILKGYYGRTNAEFFATPTVVVGPQTFNTPSCSTTGPSQAIVIDLEKAYTPTPGTSSLSFFHRWSGIGGWVYRVGSHKNGWPVKIGFDRSPGYGTITASDSVNFKVWTDSTNRAFCTPVLALANESEVRASEGILVHIEPGNYTGGVSGPDQGDYIIGLVRFGTNLGFQFSGFAIHEPFHALGFGHTCAWKSVMRSSCGVSNDEAITPEDVAHILYMKRVRELERKYNTRFSLSGMHQWERKQAGLSEEAVVYVREDGTFGSVSNPGGPLVVLQQNGK